MLQEYLTRTIVLPNLQISPSTSFHPLPPSRSTSSTRKPLSLPAAYFPDPAHQPNRPSPICDMSFPSSDDVAMATPSQRPSNLRSSSSYGFETSLSTPGSPTGFEGDAFAPLSQPSDPQSIDPWGRLRQQGQSDSKPNPWAAFGIQQSSFAQRQATHQQPYQHERNQQVVQRAPPTPPEEEDDEGMDEDMYQAVQGMDEEEDEESVERVTGLSGATEQDVGEWIQRGRRTQ